MDEKDVAYCGLVCTQCVPNGGCNCKVNNSCGKRLSKEGCFQYNCCIEKGVDGCWQCAQAPCGIDMLAKDKVKMRAFVRCIKEGGFQAFSTYFENSLKVGCVYHRTGVIGDFDLTSEEAVLTLLRTHK